MTDAIETFNAMVRATDTQRLARAAGASPATDRWSSSAQRFRDDPHRSFDAALQAVAAYLKPDDTLLDVGGGAGRWGLPLARCVREVVNVEPAPGMGAAFEASAREAGISNARWLQADWLSAPEIEGDVALVWHVTYFVDDILPFVQKLDRLARRRAIIIVSSTPPPNQGADVYRVLNGTDQPPVPGHRELLAVLWQAGLLPDVRIVEAEGARSTRIAAPEQVYATRDAAVDSLLRDPALEPAQREAAYAKLLAGCDQLFDAVEGGFRRRGAAPKLVLTTWETHHAG